jgi:hypothetical protein
MILLAGRAYLAHAQFNLRFDSPTRLMGLSKAALYMSCPDFDDPGGGGQPTTLYPCAISLTENSRLSNDHTELRGDAGIKKTKTYNSGDSPVVTHLTTSPPVRCLNRAERTGSLVFNVLWSYVTDTMNKDVYIETDV